ncbi:MAG: STAS domain-containing protein [Planctomycetes bacterium]|nr:STAS domain-containing protein [Planctomycetota bacterium]
MPESCLDITEVEGATIVSFRGDSILDILTIQRTGRELYNLIDEAGKRRVVLDFRAVRFLSSQALGVLLTLRRKADKAGARVVLSQARPELARVFKVTNLDQLFHFFDSNEEALAHLGDQNANGDP